MIKTIIHKLYESRHFWRTATFSEVAELYASRTLRTMAIYIGGGFASVYLFEEGLSLMVIVSYWACYYLLKVPATFIAAPVTAYFGPKHSILFSNILYIPAMIALGFYPQLGFASVLIWGLLNCMSMALYQVAYLVDFSQVKSMEHGGKELGYMNILERVAIGISPLIGGVIALFYGAPSIMWVSAAVFLVASLPLMQTLEPTPTRQKIRIEGFPWRYHRSSIVSQIGLGFDVLASGTVWSLFIAVVILPGAGDELYVTLGALSSVTILVAIVTSYTFGRLIDRRRGGDLLNISTIANAIIHAFRPFVTTPAGVVGVNVTNEVSTTGYKLAYTRGLFDTADISGQRVFYLVVTEASGNMGASIAAFILVGLLYFLPDITAMQLFYFIVALVVLLITTVHFRIYRR
ncbi:MAG: rane protein of unknown function [Candidatus Saccharibacteria bacterium]|nr:rane protein of unknown function [Candidatus Saccharibacteria bacterium]